MVIFTAKVSKGKLAVVLLIAAALLALVLFLSFRSSAPEQSAENGAVILTEGDTGEARIACLEALGWEVSSEALTSQEVRIPEEGNEVFERYNELQQSQGFDLSKYAGKTVKRYVYAVNNHPSGQTPVVATLLVYKNRIIGGDISSTAADGFMHSLFFPDSTDSAGTQTAEASDGSALSATAAQ